MEALRNGLMRPFIRVDIEVRPAGQASFVGTLKAAMYQHGAVHHYRIADADDVLWLAPPAWLPPDSIKMADAALDRMDAQFLHLCRTTPLDVLKRAMAQATGLPDGLTIEEMTARLERRAAAKLIGEQAEEAEERRIEAALQKHGSLIAAMRAGAV